MRRSRLRRAFIRSVQKSESVLFRAAVISDRWEARSRSEYTCMGDGRPELVVVEEGGAGLLFVLLWVCSRAVDGFFGRWRAHQSRRFRREELMEDFVIQLYCGIERMAFKCMVERMVAWWARSLMLIKVVGKLERVAVGLTIRGATRQWVFNLWCTVCLQK